MGLEPDLPLREYMKRRITMHFSETYFGIPLLKLPEDMSVYEHILYDSQVDCVVEVGTHTGGSALWFRHRLDALYSCGVISHPGLVISMDLDTSSAEENLPRLDRCGPSKIHLVRGDVREKASTDVVISLVPHGSRCLLVDDSAHTKETTQAFLMAFHGLCLPGCWIVVEDTVVDDSYLNPCPGIVGCSLAISEFLNTPGGSLFERVENAVRYGVSTNQGGYLRRKEGIS